jgi:hypothetical protein
VTGPAHLIPPVFDQILDDDDLTGRHVRVWRAALPYLDFIDAKPLKLDVLERELGIDRANLSRIVGRLVERGYLVRDGREPRGGAWRYRVPLARSDAPPEPVDDAPEPPPPTAPRRRMLSGGI